MANDRDDEGPDKSGEKMPRQRARRRSTQRQVAARTLSPDAASDLYRREKERRGRKPSADEQRMEAARREYEELLKADAAAGKGGRPRKAPAPAVPRDEHDIDAELEALPDAAHDDEPPEVRPRKG